MQIPPGSAIASRRGDVDDLAENITPLNITSPHIDTDP
jgi:hypothetical protein